MSVGKKERSSITYPYVLKLLINLQIGIISEPKSKTNAPEASL